MDEDQSFLELQVDDESSTQLYETAKWAKFLGVAIVIICGLFLLAMIGLWSSISQNLVGSGLGTNGENENFLRIVLIVTCFIAGAIISVLMIFLIKGANNIRKGLLHKDQLLFNSGLANFKNYFTMYGILSVISMLISLLGMFRR